mmetsp:Transcript_20157/g.51027  ORF Transcript_20157/g.51027 Transcript_20157/m.51027 type:complete len:647 (+) Transcript_20157:150-2090(+)
MGHCGTHLAIHSHLLARRHLNLGRHLPLIELHPHDSQRRLCQGRRGGVVRLGSDTQGDLVTLRRGTVCRARAHGGRYAEEHGRHDEHEARDERGAREERGLQCRASPLRRADRLARGARLAGVVVRDAVRAAHRLPLLRAGAHRAHHARRGGLLRQVRLLLQHRPRRLLAGHDSKWRRRLWSGAGGGLVRLLTGLVGRVVELGPPRLVVEPPAARRGGGRCSGWCGGGGSRGGGGGGRRRLGGGAGGELVRHLAGRVGGLRIELVPLGLVVEQPAARRGGGRCSGRGGGGGGGSIRGRGACSGRCGRAVTVAAASQRRPADQERAQERGQQRRRGRAWAVRRVELARVARHALVAVGDAVPAALGLVVARAGGDMRHARRGRRPLRRPRGRRRRRGRRLPLLLLRKPLVARALSRPHLLAFGGSRAAVSVGDSIFAAYGRPHVRASPVRIAHTGRRLRRRGGRREFEGHERRLAVQRLERRLAMGACAARRVELARGARHAAAAVVRAVGAAPRRGAVRAAHGRTVILARGLLRHSPGVKSREGLRVEHQAGIGEGELGCRDGKAERRDALAETGRGDNERARPRLLEDREGHRAGLPRWHLRCASRRSRRSRPRCRLPRGRSIGGGARDLEDELVVGSRHDLRAV